MMKAYMQGCGNSFFIADATQTILSDEGMEHTYHRLNGTRKVDGVIFVSGSDQAAVRMNYFDVDRHTGRLARASMCGNGIRCIAKFASDLGYAGDSFDVETDDGIKEVCVAKGLVTVDMGYPRGFMQVSDDDFFVDVGLPHYVRFTDELDIERTREEGAKVRYDTDILHMLGDPRDAVQFNSVRVDSGNEISILTREGGVEDVTLACGTGSVASAYVSSVAKGLRLPITVHNPGGDITVDVKDGKLVMTGPAEYIK
ncbi:MAG: diaminopimelate epimerase [Candidatus Aenigmatarchaeota archaeon]|nr:MAG: diaminopimelate epimerase [Candidatus Aenigmarchaeota archaeon]